MPAEWWPSHGVGSSARVVARRRRRRFTFVEVLVAAIILTASVGMTLAIVGSARARILRAEQRWGRAHLLSQAAEFYLMAGPDADVPDGLLPQGFTVRCDLLAAEELPEHAAESPSGWTGWRLGVFRITVYDTSGRSIGERAIEKIVREDDFY
jgi:hypothetical protein